MNSSRRTEFNQQPHLSTISARCQVVATSLPKFRKASGSNTGMTFAPTVAMDGGSKSRRVTCRPREGS